MPAASADRRAEAHLWLLLEEALRTVRGSDVEPWEAWRNFRAVGDALVAIGALDEAVAEALDGELDDALALRGVLPAGSFGATPWPDLDVLVRERPPPAAGAASVWLEAEVERHLDLFVSFGPEAQRWAAADLVRILGGPVRAFGAVGALGPAGARILDEVVASLAAAGIDAGRPPEPDAPSRPAWVDFLRARPGPLPEVHQPDEVRSPRLVLGSLDDAMVRVDEVGWSADAIELDVAVRLPVERVNDADRTPWSARVLDDREHLHLGQPQPLRRGTGRLHFTLRPGIGPGVNRLDVRITRGGERVEGTVHR